MTDDPVDAHAEAQRMSLATGGSAFLVLATQWVAKAEPIDVPVRYVPAENAPAAIPPAVAPITAEEV